MPNEHTCLPQILLGPKTNCFHGWEPWNTFVLQGLGHRIAPRQLWPVLEACFCSKNLALILEIGRLARNSISPLEYRQGSISIGFYVPENPQNQISTKGGHVHRPPAQNLPKLGETHLASTCTCIPEPFMHPHLSTYLWGCFQTFI